MHSPSSRLLRIPTISSSVSTPDLQNLEKRYSLSKSNDETSSAPPNLVPSLKLGSVECITSPEMISSSAPGSLQSSPRKQNKDFVPAAATPEAVDRPRTLPPKNAAELQKHIKEYEEISKQIKKAMEKEAKEKMKRDNLKSCREKKLLEFRKVWTEEVIPQWEKKKDTKKVQDMWRVGLPPSVRGHVWKLSIGNELMITNDLYKISVLHAKQTKETMFGSPQLPDGANLPISPIHNKRMGGRGEIITNPVPMDELLGREGTVALVSLLDLPSDFPARELFTQDGPMYKQFADVLEAYVAYRPDVGYSPCMSYLVAGFLLNMETLDTFICLANFINKPFNLAFYITDRSQMYKYTIAADTIILTLLPKIHKHFKEVNIEPENYLVDWFMTLFLKSLPLDIASRVWDIYFLEGEIFLFKVALALLKTYSHQFESYPRDLCINLLNSFPKDISEDTLFENIALFNLDQKKFNKLLET